MFITLTHISLRSVLLILLRSGSVLLRSVLVLLILLPSVLLLYCKRTKIIANLRKNEDL